MRGRPALDGIDLTISNRELLAIVGPSGSGKSTLLRLMAGLESPDAGTFTLGGRRAGDLGPQDRDAALVFQNQAPFPHLNGRENLAFGAKARGVSPSEIQERVRSIADYLGLEDCLDRMPATMSGGEKQRLALGRALVRRPSLLLLDEPFSNLDAPLRVFLRTKLAEAHRRFGMTTILVTHDQEEAMAMGDRLAVLHEGRIEQIGSARELYDRPANQFVAGFLGSPPMTMTPVTVLLREEHSVIRFAGGTNIAVHLSGSAEALGRDASVSLLLGLRPEHLRPVHLPAESDGSVLSVRVLSLEDRGIDRIARVGRSAMEFWIRLPSEVRARIDDEILIRPDLDHASWFDSKTGLRIA